MPNTTRTVTQDSITIDRSANYSTSTSALTALLISTSASQSTLPSKSPTISSVDESMLSSAYPGQAVASMFHTF